MRTTKTLLIAAAALAATVTASQAQTVYSQNVVGYVNVSIPQGATLVGNSLDETPTSNTVNTVLTTGFVGQGTSPQNETTAFYWTGAGYDTLDYYNASDVGYPTSGYLPGWYDASSGLYASNYFGPGVSLFIENPTVSTLTTTVTGTVDQGTNGVVAVKPGFNLYAENVPLAGTALDSTNVNFPATGSAADEYQLWLGTGYGTPAGLGDGLNYYNKSDVGYPTSGYLPGWYDIGSGTYEDTNPSYWPNVGQGFIVIHGGGTSNWVSTFTVQ